MKGRVSVPLSAARVRLPEGRVAYSASGASLLFLLFPSSAISDGWGRPKALREGAFARGHPGEAHLAVRR